MFSLCHIPTLLCATVLTLASPMTFFLPLPSLIDSFGFPPHIANSPAAWPIFQANNARGTVLGVLMFYFYVKGRYDVCDVFLVVEGGYLGLVDAWLVAREGRRHGK